MLDPQSQSVNPKSHTHLPNNPSPLQRNTSPPEKDLQAKAMTDCCGIPTSTRPLHLPQTPPPPTHTRSRKRALPHTYHPDPPSSREANHPPPRPPKVRYDANQLRRLKGPAALSHSVALWVLRSARRHPALMIRLTYGSQSTSSQETKRFGEDRGDIR